MTSVRRVPTPITSARALVTALEQGGFKVVERHTSPQPLLSWRKQPMGVAAEIIVRKAQIGSTADDLGFTRGPTGAFEALLSDIHLSRFDRRWFQKLIERAASAGAAAGEGYDAPMAAGRAPAVAKPDDAAPPPSLDAVPPPLEPAARAKAAEGDVGQSPRRKPPAAVANAIQEVLQNFEAHGSSAAGASQASSEALDLERELLEVLGAARKASGSLGCGPVFFGWLLVSAIALSNRAPQLVFFASVVALALFLRAAKRRTERMAASGAAAFAARFRGDLRLREQALRKLRAGLVKHAADFKPVVEDMLRRLGG